MSIYSRVGPLVVGCVLALITSIAAADQPDNVLARNKWTDLTRDDYDAALARIPESVRAEVPMSAKRVQTILNNLLINKTLAAQARARDKGSIPDASNSDYEATRLLAVAELERVEAEAGVAFDAQKAAFEAQARENYVLERERYRVPEQIRFSDIAVTIKDRGDDAALARAFAARARLVAGDDFGAVAREYSDDPVAREKGGALPFVSQKELAPELAAGVFAKRVGEISQPIKGPTAYHVVRVDERRPSYLMPFEEVRGAMIQELRQQYIAKQREARLKSIYADPDLEVNQPAVDALVRRIDPTVLDESATGQSTRASSSSK